MDDNKNPAKAGGETTQNFDIITSQTEQPVNTNVETFGDDEDDKERMWAALMDEVNAMESRPVDWDATLARALSDASFMFQADMLELAAQAFKDPIQWARLKQWIDTHKLPGLDKRRWQKEVRMTASSLTVVQGGAGQTAVATPTVGSVWPDAPDPLLALVPGWRYGLGGVSVETDKGVIAVADPAYVHEWSKDIHDSAVNLTIAHRVGGKWESLVIPASTLLKVDKVGLLADQGLGIAEPRSLGRYLNDHYQLIRQAVPAIAGTKVSGVQTVNGQRVAVLPEGVWHGTKQATHSVRLTDTAGVSFINVRPAPGNEAVAKEVMSHIVQVGRPNKILLLAGWMAASLWADQIRETFEHRFPVANIYAIHESGKTTILKRLLSAIHGGGEIGTARDTRFRLTRQMAAATTIPLVLDEFRINEISPPQLSSLYDLCRRNYDGSTDGRGRADQTVKAYQLSAPTLVSGESRITDTALMDRIVAVSLNPEDARGWAGGTSHLRWLEEHPTESHQCAGYLLQKRLDAPMNNAQLRQRVQLLENWLRQLPESQGWPERALWGLAVVGFGLEWLEALGMAGHLGRADWISTLLEGQLARKTSSPVDRFVRFLEEVAGAGGKWRTQPVPMAVVESTGELRIGVSAANTAFALWAKDIGLPSLGQENLEDELSRSGLASADEPLKKTRTLGPPVNAKVHAYSLNLYRIAERYDISTEYWQGVLRPAHVED